MLREQVSVKRNKFSTAVNGLQLYLPVLLVVVVTFVIYSASFGHGFLITWDDNVYVTSNELIRSFTFEHIKAAFTTFFVGNYSPLQQLSYMLDYYLWGLLPTGYIFTNIFLHAVNGVLLYRMALELKMKRRWALLSSLIFVSHPVQVESVVWISQRKNVLAMTFFLLAFYLYTQYRAAGKQRESAYYIASIAVFVCAILTKSVTVIFPVALFLYDHCFLLKKDNNRSFVDKIPYLFFATIAAVLAFVSQSPEIGGGRVAYPENILSIIFTMLPVLVRYMSLVLWPANLSASYAILIRHTSDNQVIAATLLLILIVIGMAYSFRTNRRFFFAASLFFLGLVPVSQIIPFASLINDRYLYFPLLGIALAGGEMFSLVWEQRDKLIVKIIIRVLGCILLVLPLLSFSRTFVWNSDVSLWTDATVKDPDNAFAWMQLGSAYHKNKDLNKALIYYHRALALKPEDFTALKNISLTYLKKHDYEQARTYLLRLVELYPRYSGGYEDIALTYEQTGNTAEAERYYRIALSIKPH